MKLHEIESWALSVIDRILAGGHAEDIRVELKAGWPDNPADAARRIAGHANAARGAPILWLIGVDEKGRRVSGAPQTELASWWSQVQSSFDGDAPRLIDINVLHGGTNLVALYFETERAPFVVRNPKGGQVTFEVPWREATGTRTARREDLIRILVPALRVPDAEVLSATIREINRRDALNQTATLGYLQVEACILPHTESPLYVLFHRCEARFRIGGASWMPLECVRLGAPGAQHSGDYLLRTIRWSQYEARIEGPARVELHGDFPYAELQAARSRVIERQQDDIEIVASLHVVGADLPLIIEARLSAAKVTHRKQIGRWITRK